MKNRIPRLLCVAALAVSLASGQQSPERPSEPLTIQAAVSLAARNYPAIRASLAEVGAAESGIDLARTAYLPRTALRLGVQPRHAQQRLRADLSERRDPGHLRTGTRRVNGDDHVWQLSWSAVVL